MSDLLLTALQAKYRFPHPDGKGLINIEDLFDLSLEKLNTTAKAANTLLKAETEEDFITKASTKSIELSNKLEIVKLVIKVKQEQAAARAAAKAAADNARTRKQMLLEALANKQLQSVQATSEADILKELEALQAAGY